MYVLNAISRSERPAFQVNFKYIFQFMHVKMIPFCFHLWELNIQLRFSF